MEEPSLDGLPEGRIAILDMPVDVNDCLAVIAEPDIRGQRRLLHFVNVGQDGHPDAGCSDEREADKLDLIDAFDFLRLRRGAADGLGVLGMEETVDVSAIPCFRQGVNRCSEEVQSNVGLMETVGVSFGCWC